MNGNDLMNALSGIDPKYIDEAAYELHGAKSATKPLEPEAGVETGSAKVVNITNKQRLRRNLLVVLPSVAAVLLIMCVALPAVLKVSKSESATAEAPMPSAAMEDAAPAADAAAEAEPVAEAPAAEAEMAEGAAEAENAEAPAEDTDMAKTEAQTAQEHTYDADATETLGPKKTTNARGENAEAVSEAEESAAVPSWNISEAEYEDGMLILKLDGVVTEDTVKAEYKLTKADAKDTDKPISEGILSDLMEREDITDNFLILNLEKLKLKNGRYRITIGEGSTEFEVK